MRLQNYTFEETLKFVGYIVFKYPTGAEAMFFNSTASKESLKIYLKKASSIPNFTITEFYP